MSGKLIIVSNRLPFKIEKKGGKYEIRQSSGGLVSAIKSLPKETGIVWIGAADFKEEAWLDYNRTSTGSDYQIVPLFLDKKTERLYYNGFSNTMIWPLFHYFPSFAEYDSEYYSAYKDINRQFAEKIKAIAGVEDHIWIHDYHLMLVPGFLKQGPRPLSSSFFLHIPFPSYEIMKLIPEDWRNEILNSLLSADVVGFHTKEYVSHFKTSLSFFLGSECNNGFVNLSGHTTLIKDYPISIDYRQFNSAYDDAEVQKGRALIRQKYSNARIIFSLDRLDYSKGVINRLLAYEKLIQSTLSVRGQVVFIINVVPSREEISKYAERKKMIEENISRINGLYGSIHWQPIIYQYRHLNFTDLMACYTACDVALVTPLRDGMNLVAKEFVASRKDKKGVLILSEFAGASNELNGAILVNPNDLDLMQSAILKAIRLKPAEQEVRLSDMQQHLMHYDINMWLEDYMRDMRQVKTQNIGAAPKIMSFEDKIKIFEAYKAARKRLILLDYDGTLIRFYNRPEEAVPGEVIRELLHRLTGNPLNRVVLVSGRDAATLKQWFGSTGVDIAAEHGSMYLRHAEGKNIPYALAPLWKADVKALMQKYTEQVPGSFIEEKDYTVAWHYRAVEDITVETSKLKLSKELMILNEKKEFDILAGNKVLEVKSAGVNKGKFVSGLMQSEEFDFVVALGDDVTDEDMFSVLTSENHYSIKVGLSSTNAKFNLININNVLSFLDQMSSFKNRERPIRQQ